MKSYDDTNAAAADDDAMVKKSKKSTNLKDLCNANACWLVLINNTLIITKVAKRLFKYVPYILL